MTLVYEGRTYKELQVFLKEFPDTRIMEMDTVIGCEGFRKVLLTFHFSACSFMRAYLLDNKEARHVKAVFDSIEQAIGTFSFSSAFSLILTDRGSEFQNPDALECGQDNRIRTSIYYCDPMCSWQKPHCEKNHEYIRKICPKGTSFDNYSQRDIVWMMSHINTGITQKIKPDNNEKSADTDPIYFSADKWNLVFSVEFKFTCGIYFFTQPIY